MRLVIDFVSANQVWHADSGKQRNIAVLNIAGHIHEVECSAEQLQAIIAAAAGQSTGSASVSAAIMEASLERELRTEDDGDEVFGGDVAVPPAMFQAEPSTETSAETAIAAASPPPYAAPPSSGQQRETAIEQRRTQDPGAVRVTAKAVMRERAKAIPPRRVEKDEMGNPIVRPIAEGRSGSAGQPEVLRRAPEAPVGGTDDDGFSQG